ncbi:hypothetical protein B0A77_11755 [Flavobacterium branchiophilum]|uniref:Uncharacterized protein n=2 Tax=Flavobacterium branchiophilum TaxID=55197 RepID=A0A2H3KBF9_9FLAO|nr:hypothetical protein B0A77_11755 [Flavobacterium branchiophilum]
MKQMEESTKIKILRYNFEEIIFILIIIAYDLTKYTKDELSDFNEAIEGRIEVLFKKEFLLILREHYVISNDLVYKLESLKNDIVNLYESNWMKKLLENDQQIHFLKSKASEILLELKIEENDAKKYSEDNLVINW